MDWRASEPSSVYEFPFPAKPKSERGAYNAKKDEDRNFQAAIANCLEEQSQRRLADKHIGCRVSFVTKKRIADLDNCIKNLWDGMKRLAFEDDKHFDYMEVVNVPAQQDAEQILIEIFTHDRRRQAWV